MQCDEMSPSCTSCVLRLKECIYLRAPQSLANDCSDKVSPPNSSRSSLTLSPNASSYSEQPPSLKASPCSTSALAEADRCSNAADAPEGLSDTALYQHYLQHTSHTLTHCPKDQWAFQIGMPTLSLQSQIVFHSLLAVSAACLGCDMISKESLPNIRAVKEVLMTGYRHYNLASEGIRESISRPEASKPEPLLASAMLLVPFATASQRINHWISSRSETQTSYKLLQTTPRDVIVITRGIQATLKTLDCGSLSPNHQPSPEEKFALDSPPALPDINAQPASLAPSRTHVMFPILAATSETAFVKLQERLESTSLYHSSGRKDSLSACGAAFAVLRDIRNTAFSSSSPNELLEKSFQPQLVSLPQVAPWLRSLANRPETPTPTGPLTRFFLTFFYQTPQAYIDILLPLLDQMRERPVARTSDNLSVELTVEQTLALDIYAHWSVLQFLVEEESWWIGNLPFVTLSGLVKTYGDDFVSRLWPKTCAEQDQWWPGCMLNIYQEIKRYR